MILNQNIDRSLYLVRNTLQAFRNVLILIDKIINFKIIFDVEKIYHNK